MTMFYVLANACSQIPCPVFRIAYVVKLLIQWAVPVVLVILGMLDFTKAAMANDESGISKAKQSFIKRLIAAVSVFFVMTVLELTFNVLASSADKAGDEGLDGRSVWHCVKQIFDGSQDNCDNTPFTDDPVTPDPDADPE